MLGEYRGYWSVLALGALIATGCGDNSSGAVDATPVADAAAIDAAAIDAVVVDAPPPPPDAPVDAMVNDAFTPACLTADAAGAAAVTIVNGTITPNGQGGELTTGMWELDAATFDAPLTIGGTVQSLMNIEASTPTLGGAAMHLLATITSPVSTTADEFGFGAYSTTGSMVTISEVASCGAAPPIAMAEYTATATEVTLWGTISVMGIPVDVEVHFTKQ